MALTVRGTTVDIAGSVEGSVMVANAGPVASDEVVQLYSSDTATRLVRPAQELVGVPPDAARTREDPDGRSSWTGGRSCLSASRVG